MVETSVFRGALKKYTPITTLAMLAASAMSVQSAIVVQTTRGGPGDQANLSATSGSTSTLGAGQTFTSGALGIETLLSSVDLIMPNTTGGADPNGPFTVEIWTDLDNDATTFDPGALVAASDNQITIVGGNVTLTANFSSGLLTDNTVYLLSFNDGVDSHSSFRMGLTTDNNPLGSTGKLFQNGGDPAFGDNREIAFTVTTTAVPEPSSAALLGLGTLALIMRRRR